MSSNTFILKPFVQHYDWGKIGEESLVASLIKSGHGRFISNELSFAELWMGEHPNGPCDVIDDDGYIVSISSWLSREALPRIPFLFKVLSIRKALSIQFHPDADLAAKLHATRPDIYKDANPKPELAIALTPFKALFGFRPIREVVRLIDETPVLAEWFGEEILSPMRTVESPDEVAATMKSAYKTLMTAPQDRVQHAIDQIITSDSLSDRLTLRWIRELNSQFPGVDVGILSVIFLNIIQLQPGDCLFIVPILPMRI